MDELNISILKLVYNKKRLFKPQDKEKVNRWIMSLVLSEELSQWIQDYDEAMEICQKLLETNVSPSFFNDIDLLEKELKNSLKSQLSKESTSIKDWRIRPIYEGELFQDNYTEEEDVENIIQKYIDSGIDSLLKTLKCQTTIKGERAVLNKFAWCMSQEELSVFEEKQIRFNQIVEKEVNTLFVVRYNTWQKYS